MPFPPLDGGAQAIFYTTTGLVKKDVQLKTVAINTPKFWIDVSKISEEYTQPCRFETVVVDTRIKPFDALINLFKTESYILERFISNKFADRLTEILQKEQFDIVQLEYLFLCKYIAVIRKYSDAKIVLRPQNIEFVVWERYLKNLKNPLKKFFLSNAVKRLKRYEKSIGSELDGIIALTKQDREVFESFGLNAPIIELPMGYNMDRIENPKGITDTDELTVYHLGSMDWLPNLEAITWFLQHVLPLLKNKLNHVKVVIAGRHMPRWVYSHEDESFTVVGEVNDPLGFQLNKQIMIVPLLSGSGIRAKIIEGLALGKTIISTTVGAQGIYYQDGKNILIADTPEQFSEAILRCVKNRDLCNRLGENARALAEKEYDYLLIADKMIRFYRELLNANGN